MRESASFFVYPMPEGDAVRARGKPIDAEMDPAMGAGGSGHGAYLRGFFHTRAGFAGVRALGHPRQKTGAYDRVCPSGRSLLSRPVRRRTLSLDSADRPHGSGAPLCIFRRMASGLCPRAERLAPRRGHRRGGKHDRSCRMAPTPEAASMGAPGARTPPPAVLGRSALRRAAMAQIFGRGGRHQRRRVFPGAEDQSGHEPLQFLRQLDPFLLFFLQTQFLLKEILLQ